MPFEYDPAKSRANKLKHGIDFEEAKAIWSDPSAIDFPARTVGEQRIVVIGLIGEALWSAVVTHRGGNIRIISVRRARKKEVEHYESQQVR